MPPKIEIKQNQVFGDWQIMYEAKKATNNIRRFVCFCSKCKSIKTVFLNSLRNGTSKGCGCQRVIRNKVSTLNVLHGMYKTRLYTIWSGMKGRCKSKKGKNLKNYVDRNINVCDEWQKFEPFFNWAINNGYQNTLTIDRKNNDLGYCPENCRWATYTEQNNNKRDNKKCA